MVKKSLQKKLLVAENKLNSHHILNTKVVIAGRFHTKYLTTQDC